MQVSQLIKYRLLLFGLGNSHCHSPFHTIHSHSLTHKEPLISVQTQITLFVTSRHTILQDERAPNTIESSAM